MKKLDRNAIAARVARDIPEGAYVNLGIGLPTLVAGHLPKDREVILPNDFWNPLRFTLDPTLHILHPKNG